MASRDVHLFHPADCATCVAFPADLACLSHTCPDCGSIVHGQVNTAGELVHTCPEADPGRDFWVRMAWGF